jgi:hypothetical protein
MALNIRNHETEKLTSDLAALPLLDRRSPEDMLYDERGLPR